MKHYAQLFWEEFTMTLKQPLTWITALIILVGIAGISYAQTDCSELIQACKMKRQLGEQGQGNCKAARACQQQQCGELRQACLNRDSLGERGQGNCRRYRETCRR
jgi:hypothetical protein